MAEEVVAVEQVVESVPVLPQSASGLSGIWLFVIILAVLYIIMYLPQRRRQKEYKKMLDSLKVGARVMNAGGIFGKIKKIEEKTLELEIAKGVVIEIAKNSVVNVE